MKKVFVSAIINYYFTLLSVFKGTDWLDLMSPRVTRLVTGFRFLNLSLNFEKDVKIL